MNPPAKAPHRTSTQNTEEHISRCAMCAATKLNESEAAGVDKQACVHCETAAHPCHDRCQPCPLCKAPAGQHQAWCWKQMWPKTMHMAHMTQLRTRRQCLRCERLCNDEYDQTGCDGTNCICTSCNSLKVDDSESEDPHASTCHKRCLTVKSRVVDPAMAANIRHRTKMYLASCNLTGH